MLHSQQSQQAIHTTTLPPHHQREPVYDVYGGHQYHVSREFIDPQIDCHNTLKTGKPVTVFTDSINNDYTHIWERPLPHPITVENQSV